MLKIDRWITFKPWKLRAVMDGDATETRRVINGPGNGWHIDRLLGDWPLSSLPYQYDGTDPDFSIPWSWQGKKPPQIGDWCWEVQTDVDDTATYSIPCPYGEPGDALGIKEGYRIIHDIPRGRFVTGEYLTDNAHFEIELTQPEYDKWAARKHPYRATPGRFMYRSLCRTRLLVKRVSVERVRDISRESIDAEGTPMKPGQMNYRNDYYQRLKDFEYIWDEINTKRGYTFSANNWVWVVEFERIAE